MLSRSVGSWWAKETAVEMRGRRGLTTGVQPLARACLRRYPADWHARDSRLQRHVRRWLFYVRRAETLAMASATVSFGALAISVA